MEKIISLFQRNYAGDHLVRDEVVPGAEWVLAGEGVATVKYDGTCCLVRDGKLYKRYDAKRGKQPPDNFIPAQAEADPVTGHWPGWVPVGDGPEDLWHRQALNVEQADGEPLLRDGTYELVGPKVQGNPYHLSAHQLWPHGGGRYGRYTEGVNAPPRTFAGLRAWFTAQCYPMGSSTPRAWVDDHNWPVEGIVWHHPDGRMVKIKRRDFGLPWPVPPGS